MSFTGLIPSSHTQHTHEVQFYENSDFLAQKVAEFVGRGLSAGEGGIIIAKPENLSAITEAFLAAGIDVEAAKLNGQLRMIDAAAALATFTFNGIPDAEKFSSEIGGLIEKMNQRHPSIRAYGEMVGLLWDAGEHEATIQLEKLWNNLSKTHPYFSLLCGYSIHSFENETHRAAFADICHTHSHVLPTEGFLELKDLKSQNKRIALLEQQAKALETELLKRKRAEDRLRESEAFKDAIINSSLDSIKVLSLQGEILFHNKVRLRFENIEKDESTTGSSWFNLWKDADVRALAEKAFAESQSTGLSEFTAEVSEPNFLRSKWWQTILTSVKGPDGQAEFILAVSRNITESKNLELDLRDAVKARDELISICSHELKTPLTALRLQSELAKKRMMKEFSTLHQPEELRKLVASYEKYTERLVHLVDNMIDFTQIRSGKLQLEAEEVKLSQLIYEVLERLTDRFNAAGCEITVKAAPGIVGLWDRGRLEQVLTHLLSNAVRYGEKKPIEIRTSKNGHLVTLSVQDHGMGIATENKGRIFNRFERAVCANEISGLGLGLYLCSEIVKEHGGNISVQSELGSGSTFTVELPIH